MLPCQSDHRQSSLKLKGALRLRGFAPELPIVVPLPPLTPVEKLAVTEWERRLIDREGFG